MSAKTLSVSRARQILAAAHKTRVLVVGDVMLDQFIWGGVSRISPEAPVPVVDFSRESFMPGGAANVARNLVSLATPAELFGAIGNDDAARKLLKLLGEQDIGCTGLVKNSARHTSIKTRIVAHRQQVVRIDRETRGAIDAKTTAKLLTEFKTRLAQADAVIVGDYGKGVVTQALLNEIKSLCRERGVWLSLDPKPVHHLNLSNLSLITPNRREAFELADLPDDTKNENPFGQKFDAGRGTAAERIAAGLAARHAGRTRHVALPARAKAVSHPDRRAGSIRCFRCG
jgi:rfaE bifunctional protein kinase chain/domain